MTETATAPKGQTILPKMSIKTLGLNGAVVLVTKVKTPLARVFGICTGIKVAEGNDGSPVFGFTGQFLGKNLHNDEEFASGVLYLPAGIAEMFMSPLEAALGEDKKASVRLALDLFAVPSTNRAGYSFEAASLMATSAIDPFKELKEAASAAEIPALPAALAAAKTEAIEKATADQAAAVEKAKADAEAAKAAKA